MISYNAWASSQRERFSRRRRSKTQMRTFVAIPLPPQCRALLDAIQTELRRSAAEVRWTAITSIHLTLKFLGEIDPAVVPRLADALRAEAACDPPFSLRLHGLGSFPGLRDPRVIWCGLEGETDRLGALQSKVERACQGLGFASEEHPFHPHLTLGRVRGKRNLHRLVEYIRIGSDLECDFSVDHFHIYKSTLTPRGAVYDILEKIDLHG